MSLKKIIGAAAVRIILWDSDRYEKLTGLVKIITINTITRITLKVTLLSISIIKMIRMKTDGQHKLDELTRRLGVFEEEFKRSTDRANCADNKVIMGQLIR